MNKQSLAVLLAASSFTTGLFAQIQPLGIETVLVTATRTAVLADETLASVSVINRQTIEQLQPFDMLDLLAHTPGVDVSRNGGRGANASLYLRGTNNGHTLVLVDGVRQGSATLGTVSLQHINVQQVERVEIVRGPRSSLYGSEALGGVVQIFTRKPQGQFKPTISLGFGSNDTRNSSLAVSGRLGENVIGLTLSHLATEGIDNQVYDGNTDDDDDAYRNSSANLNFSRSFDDGMELSARYNQSKGQIEYDQGDGFSAKENAAPYGEFKIESSSLSLSVPVTETWLSTFSLGHSTDENQSRDDNLVKLDEFLTHRNQAAWQNDLQLNDNYLVTLGYDYLEDEVDGTQTYSEDRRSNRAVFGQLQGKMSEHFNVNAGFRRDNNEQFGYTTTYNFSIGYELSAAHLLVLSRGSAFKAPTFNDLYWPVSPWSAGNTKLVPEESVNTELELRGNYDGFSWTLTAYRNDIDNLIDWAATSPGFWQPSNVDSAKIRGSEFSVVTTVADWELTAAASYLKPEDELTGNLLTRRAKKSVSAHLQRQFGDLSVGFNWKAQSHRFDDSANTTRLAGYGILGVRLSYTVNPKLTANFSVDNVFEKNYQLSEDYATDGGSALISMTYKM